MDITTWRVWAATSARREPAQGRRMALGYARSRCHRRTKGVLSRTLGRKYPGDGVGASSSRGSRCRTRAVASAAQPLPTAAIHSCCDRRCVSVGSLVIALAWGQMASAECDTTANVPLVMRVVQQLSVNHPADAGYTKRVRLTVSPDEDAAL